MLTFKLGFALGGTALAALVALAGQPAVASWVIVAIAAVVMASKAWDMVQTLLHGGFGVDVLALVAVLTALVLGETIAAAVIIIMLASGEALEQYAERHARKELTALMERTPKIAHVWRGHLTEDVPVEQVKPGDELEIKPGEVVPVDARLTEGAGSLDEAAITGESLPVYKRPGDILLSGSVNTDTSLHVEAVHTSASSQYAQIIALVEDAASRRSPLVRLADRYSLPFTLLAFALAGGAWAASGNPRHALEVLVVATPCPLLIAAPVAIVSGMSRAAAAGIIAKSGAALERLARLRTVAFDKTGTLTRGQPVVASVRVARPFHEDQVLAAAAAAEQSSVHILAKAVIAAAARRHVSVERATHVHEDAGHGLRARVDGRAVVVGRLQYLHISGIPLPPQLHSDRTASYVAIGGQYAGCITFTDQIRPETPEVLRRLRQLGVSHTLMLTGDRASVAERVAEQLGISDVRADCLPADKVAAIRQLAPALRPVAMVGDGVNDAPTLAASDVGIALGAKGSTAASQSADIVIMPDDLGRLPVAIELARRAVTIAKQSIFIGIGLSVCLMVWAAVGGIPPVIGALLQELVDVAVILNALRARRI